MEQKILGWYGHLYNIIIIRFTTICCLVFVSISCLQIQPVLLFFLLLPTNSLFFPVLLLYFCPTFGAVFLFSSRLLSSLPILASLALCLPSLAGGRLVVVSAQHNLLITISNSSLTYTFSFLCLLVMLSDISSQSLGVYFTMICICRCQYWSEYRFVYIYFCSS